MKIIERNLQEIGKSLLVTLPKPWTDSLKLKKGSKVKIAVTDQGTLFISPEIAEHEKQTETTIVYDEYYWRRFFREYFHGHEKIIIKFDKKLNEDQRKRIYSFLSRFMNSQIIEESNNKIVVKCFKIEELSIKECLNRVYHLSISIFDEFLENNDKTKMYEMDDTITKFYYMLVMQVRRYLEEGKYTEGGQISLISAMDYRMVAEKIERISDIIKLLNTSQFIDISKKTKELYSRAFYSYINKNYEEALKLSSEITIHLKNIDLKISQTEKTGNLKKYKELKSLHDITILFRDISMLVR